MDLIKDLWRGNVPLSRTFWIFYFGVNLLLNISLLYLNLTDLVTTKIGLVFFLLLLSVSVAYGPFILISVWRSANKYEGLQRYTIAAKFMVLFGWIRYLQLLLGWAKEFSG